MEPTGDQTKPKPKRHPEHSKTGEKYSKQKMNIDDVSQRKHTVFQISKRLIVWCVPTLY